VQFHLCKDVGSHPFDLFVYRHIFSLNNEKFTSKVEKTANLRNEKSVYFVPEIDFLVCDD